MNRRISIKTEQLEEEKVCVGHIRQRVCVSHQVL